MTVDHPHTTRKTTGRKETSVQEAFKGSKGAGGEGGGGGLSLCMAVVVRP